MVQWGRRYSFGNPGHYDIDCANFVTWQHTGRKKWTVWAPWDVRLADDNETVVIPAHARLEVTLKPGEMLFVPQAGRLYIGVTCLNYYCILTSRYFKVSFLQVPRRGSAR